LKVDETAEIGGYRSCEIQPRETEEGEGFDVADVRRQSPAVGFFNDGAPTEGDGDDEAI